MSVLDPLARRAQVVRRVIERQRQLRAGVTSVGRFTYGVPAVYRFEGEAATVTIGSFVSIARGVEILLGGRHRMDWVTTFPLHWHLRLPTPAEAVDSGGSVVIGNDVWLGQGALVMPGVTIGSGSVVGARSVVTSDVRPYAVVVGNPPAEVRRRFSDDQVEELLALAWWDWEIERIRRAVPLLCSGEVDRLLRPGGPPS